MTRKVCLFEDCGNYTKGRGYKMCSTHATINALQQEIERLRAQSPEGVWRILRHPEVRRTIQLIYRLDERSQPMRGASTEVTARSRSHNADDGVVAVGDHRVIPGYAVASYADSGRLGAALSALKTANDKIENISDPSRRKPKDIRKRCGRRSCPKPNYRQEPDTVFCRFCGEKIGGSNGEEARGG